MVYLLFLFDPQQTILQARSCIQREMTKVTNQHQHHRRLHADALSLLDSVREMPPHGLVVTENVCFDTKVRVPAFEYFCGDSTAIQKRIAYYYTHE